MSPAVDSGSLVDCLGIDANARDRRLLETALDDFYATGKRAWPELAVPAPQLVMRLPDKLDVNQSAPAIAEALAQLSAEEVFLAVACMVNAAGATESFDRHYVAPTRAGLIRTGLSDSDIQDIHQELREKLLVAGPGEVFRLWQYCGGGKLSALLRVMASRMAVSQHRRIKPAALEEDELTVWAAESHDPAIRAVRDQCSAEFKQALERACQRLSARERNLLRLHYVDGLKVEEIAGLYGAHRVSASRWLAKARDTVGRETRRELRGRLKLSSEQFQSLVAAMDSKLDISISRILASRMSA